MNDARLWHPWLRINRVLRVMLQTRWSGEAWPQVRVDRALHALCRSVLPLVALLLAGCATFVNLQADREAGRETTRTYAVSMDDAWRISKTVLRWEGGNAIDENREGGYMMTEFRETYGGVAGFWLEPVGDNVKVTAVIKGGLLYEDWLHLRFTQAVEILNAGQALTTTAPPAPRSR